MENQFDGVMQKRTDAELVKILNAPFDDYQPDALEAAKREFERRNLSEAQITSVTLEIEQKQEMDEVKANTPLGTFLKVFAFIFPGIILLMFAGIFKADGYDRKAKELIRWTLYGFGAYVGIVVLIILLTFIF